MPAAAMLAEFSASDMPSSPIAQVPVEILLKAHPAHDSWLRVLVGAESMEFSFINWRTSVGSNRHTRLEEPFWPRFIRELATALRARTTRAGSSLVRSVPK